MLKLKTLLVATAIFMPFQLYAQTACNSYTIASGDTLRLIAERVYGSRDLSPIIYNANRYVVGSNPNNIEIGMRIEIPCRETDGATNLSPVANAVVVESDAQTEVAVETTVEEPTTQEPVVEEIETIQAATGVVFPAQPTFVSVGMFPPFADGEGNGLMTDIVRAALTGTEYLNDVEINSVSQPFDPLMASVDPDVILSFPWVNPGCDEAGFLSERSVDLCENYQFSQKTYDIVMTFFVADRGGLAQATEARQFAGKRICVPEQYPTSHLGAAGFSAPDVFIDRGNSVAECMSKLLSGQTDVVNADYLSVESTYAVLSSQSIIVENPSFTWIRSVHAIANVNNPASLQTLTAFNDGLSRIKENGDWLTITQPYLQ